MAVVDHKPLSTLPVASRQEVNLSGTGLEV